MKYRRATIEDVPVLRQLHVDFMNEIGQTFWDDTTWLYTDWMQQYFIRHLAASDCICWICQEEGAVIGASAICFNEELQSADRTRKERGYIMNVYVAKPYRGDGIGKVLLQKLIDDAYSRGVTTINLHATEASIKLYKGFGFKPVLDDTVASPNYWELVNG